MEGLQQWLAPILWFAGSMVALITFYQKALKPPLDKMKKISDSIATLTLDLNEVHECVDKIEARIEHLEEKVKIINDAECSIVRDRIMQFYRYHMTNSQNGLSMAEKESIDAMYISYKTLGGNHFIDGLMAQINQLPLLVLDGQGEFKSIDQQNVH